MQDDTPHELLPWTTPRLDLIGTIGDIRNGKPVGELDDDVESGTAS